MYVNGMREGKAKCKVRQNTQDPVWHHQVVFEINRENPKLLGHVFVFHVLHKDMMTGVHKIGQVRRRRFPNANLSRADMGWGGGGRRGGEGGGGGGARRSSVLGESEFFFLFCFFFFCVPP